MSDQKQENKKSQIVDSENVPSESSINAEFKDSDTSKEESKRQQMSLERNLEKSTVDQTREDLKEPMEDTGVDLEPSVEQQSAVEKSALSGKVAKSALPGEVEMYEFLSETEKSTLPEEAGKSALPAGAETSVLPEKNMLPAGVETSVLPEKSRLPAETSVLPEKNMLPAGVETSVLPEKSRLPAETSVLLEKNMLPAGAETSVLPEKNMLPAGMETSVLPEKNMLPAGMETSVLLEKSRLPAETSVLPEKNMLPAGAETSVLLEKSRLPAETSVLPEKNMLPAGVETSVLPEKSRLPAETSVLPEKNMLPAGVETSVLPEKSRLPAETSVLPEKNMLQEAVRQRALPEKTEHAVVEKLWTRVGAAVVVLLIAIGFAMCANPFGGPQTLDSRSVLQIFQGEFKRLQKDFPEQNDKLWLRSGKMLTNHLNKSHPDEPAMIILTAAQDAKRTLQCLGSGLAQTYAVALNSSWLLIHGPSQAQYDASTAKLNIDEQLSAGFETENRAAVLNNLETLPPGSLLIFFKYCDHENAAYKNVALVFTVLLEDSSLEPDTPLPELEEKVRDFLWQQFVHSVRSNQEMDSDKLSGVWSRISHLVLPVLPVERIETGNCPFDHE
ncbi:torsin-1A-interacting protein 2 isoform X2 [Rana temporaria]|uniref:torsin-1A-interacting protein 2 isoform X2 n=1 Tax=Rana temporaria TaxID=8407 RepID=UPI001AAE12CB|nr:torsin-1A-interacting protein 2 isoform X2 [Rana temporaria]